MLSLLALALQQCIPVSKEIIPTEISIDLNNPEIRHVYDLRDQRKTDSLIKYFVNGDPVLRYLAVSSFASIKDSNAIDTIAALLKDRVLPVRQAAAYALGQSGHAKAEPYLIKAFSQSDTAGKNNPYYQTILEAIGKVGSASTMKLLASIKTYTPSDTCLILGRAYGLYRFTLRGMVDTGGTAAMIRYAIDSAYAASIRTIASAYLSRSPKVITKGYDQNIISGINNNSNPFIRMNLALALAKTGSDTAFATLTRWLGSEKDIRVKCNIIRGINAFSNDDAWPTLKAVILQKEDMESQLAAELLIDSGATDFAQEYLTVSQDTTLPWQIEYTLLAAAYKWVGWDDEASREAIQARLSEGYFKETNVFAKSAIIKALAYDPRNITFIREYGLVSKSFEIKTASMEALSAIFKSSMLPYIYKDQAELVKKALINDFRKGIESADPGQVATVAAAIYNPKYHFLEMKDSTLLPALEATLKKMDPVSAIESVNEAIRAINYLKDTNIAEVLPPIKHPINWDALKNVTDSSLIQITTNKGNIILSLYPTVAPAAVANFVELIEKGYFTNKKVHRVVPNFVMQAGCNRGDGFGSLEYTLRSDYQQYYYNTEGVLGMASAGADTESQQWFITHSPAPHLDGRYTIFGKVTKGMDTVLDIQVSDTIQKITILKK